MTRDDQASPRIVVGLDGSPSLRALHRALDQAVLTDAHPPVAVQARVVEGIRRPSW